MANSKKKGNRGENQLVHILCDRFGEGKFKRTPSSGAYTGGQNRELAEHLPWQAKITLASDIITPANFNFILEHKFYAEMNFWDLFSENPQWLQWIKQAEGDAKFVNKKALVIIKYNRHKRICLIQKDFVPDKLEPLIIWRNYSVFWLDSLLKLTDDFWFNKENV